MIVVQKEEKDDSWLFTVTVKEATSTTHKVTLKKADYERLTDTMTPEALVKKSFEFLLEREPKESILRSFDLTVISTYFPEYEDVIRS